MSTSSLLIRADASVATGTGHVMRCLALAQAWQDAGGQAAFATAESTEALRTKVAAEGCELFSLSSSPGGSRDAQETTECAKKVGSQWIVVDGYPFDADYQFALKSAGFKVLFIDDYGHAKRYAADLVLNQNVSASAELYEKREANTRLLLGPRYALLRREFNRWREWERSVTPACRHLLVMMGGSDPENISARVIEALALSKLVQLETTLVVGGSNLRFADLQRSAVQSGVKVEFRMDVSNIGELMADADIAVSAAGTTCWEICLLGLPALLVDVADNQTKVAEELHRRGCAIHVGNREVVADKLAEGLRTLVGSEELRRTLSKNSRELVDGRGATRVAFFLRGVGEVRLRRVNAKDRKMLWEWANDPEVRGASFSTAAIPWETHVGWFSQKLENPQSLMLIAEDIQGGAIGQVRLDIEGREASLNISLAKEKRGRGFAVPAIEAAVRALFAERDCDRVHAFVKPGNIASARAFIAAGFAQVGSEDVRGHHALHFVYTRG
jgi:UDP-2,4-diacetamido-2,4,6-trideoxy-beta-L-altropyranose hydrolase